nr:hypothetical protein [Mycobacterium sp. Root135]
MRVDPDSGHCPQRRIATKRLVDRHVEGCGADDAPPDRVDQIGLDDAAAARDVDQMGVGLHRRQRRRVDDSGRPRGQRGGDHDEVRPPKLRRHVCTVRDAVEVGVLGAGGPPRSSDVHTQCPQFACRRPADAAASDDQAGGPGEAAHRDLLPETAVLLSGGEVELLDVGQRRGDDELGDVLVLDACGGRDRCGEMPQSG